MRKKEMYSRGFLDQHVRIKVDNKEYYQQLITMINQSPELQIISESFDEIVIVSTPTKQYVNDLFPKVRTINKELSLYNHRKNIHFKKLIKFLSLSSKKKKTSEIINISGVLINER